MKYFYMLLMLAGSSATSFAQDLIKSYPKIVNTPSDTIYVKWNFYPDKYPKVLRGGDTVNMGTDGALGMVGTIYYGKDSIVVPYINTPNTQKLYLTFAMPKGKQGVFEFRFNGQTAAFPADYIAKNTGNVQFEIPEVYELANIIWTLSPSGQRATDLWKQGPYYEKMIAYFKPYLNHPIFKQLDFADSVFYENYYGFRENSFMYHFAKDKIVNTGPYYYVFGDEEKTDLFTRLLPLAEDFARKSKFREFYKQNQPFYAEKINREAQLMPIKSMWDWMEKQFPKRTYKSYKVVFSPLIGGSHSTQNYSSQTKNGTFNESVMFVCATDRYEKPTWTEKQKEGLMSGIVFTEIDHNYVNPVSNKYRMPIDSIFKNRAFWANEVKNYNSSMAVFNEYMTHAVFCLWVMDTYDKATADVVIGLREDLMVNRRKFSKFKEFNQTLMEMHRQQPQTPVADLYKPILAWSKAEVK
nr:DUF4932 domain-containing protein [uncultured Mucilaginibacter sp.]